jgi:hypothetical protein
MEEKARRQDTLKCIISRDSMKMKMSLQQIKGSLGGRLGEKEKYA